LAAFTTQALGRRLRLEMDKRHDEARSYLAANNLPLKTAKAVRENLREWARQADILLFLSAKKQAFAVTNSMTDKQREEAIERQARRLGWNKSDSELLAIHREKRTDAREVYLVPTAVLQSLVTLKKARKRSGGHKAARRRWPRIRNKIY